VVKNLKIKAVNHAFLWSLAFMLDEDDQSWMDLTKTKRPMVAVLSKVRVQNSVGTVKQEHIDVLLSCLASV